MQSNNSTGKLSQEQKELLDILAEIAVSIIDKQAENQKVNDKKGSI